MSTRAAANLVAAALLAATFVPHSGAQDQATAKVTYVSGTSVYVDAGSDDGLEVGQKLLAIRTDGSMVELEVTFLSTHRAACALPQGEAPPQVGDTVRYTPRAPAAAPEPAQARPSTRSPRRSRAGIVHGRIGVRYLVVRDRMQDGADYSQPSVDFRLDGNRVAGSPWGVNVDVRARRTIRTLADGTEDRDGQSRVYRAALSWQGAGSPWRLRLGRQFSPALAALSLFDGLAAEYATPRWSVGAVSGTQPDPLDYGYSDEVREHGVYFQLTGEPGVARHWQMTTGLVGSYERGEINREFVYFQGLFTGSRLSLFGTEEVDYNRGWKKLAGESTLSPTSTFLSLNWRAGDAVRLSAGYDNRRNVRLYRDFVSPETEFDDAFRRGVWAGMSLALRDRFRVGVDARQSGGGDAGDSEAYTLTFGVERVTRANLGFRSRSTRYANDRVEGWLHSLGVEVLLGSRLRLGLSGGLRDETDLTGFGAPGRLTWTSLDVDAPLGRHWLLSLSADRSDGDMEAVDQLYVTTSYRF